jgi:nitrogen fixation NifU-like protein
MYSDQVMDHFANPRNIGIIDDANVVVQVGDPGCGDVLLIFLKIADDHIRDMKYKIYGCGAAIATSSLPVKWPSAKASTKSVSPHGDRFSRRRRRRSPAETGCSFWGRFLSTRPWQPRQ